MSHFYYFLNRPVHRFSVELTNTCALACPKCSRTTKDEHGFTEDLNVTKVLSLEFIKKIFPPELAEHQKSWIIDLTGNYGDAIYHPHLHEILSYLRSLNVKLQLITNGSYRSREWWEKTARLLGPDNSLIFSIDGLRDTNPIYRVNSDWDGIMEGIRTSVPHTKVTWKWIVFSHNEHQIEQGRELAKSLGVQRFLVTKSGRLGKNDELAPKDEWLGLKSRNKTVIRELMRTRWKFTRLILGKGSEPVLRKILASPTVSPRDVTIYPRCQTGKDVFISCEGHLYPCCYSRDTVKSSWFFKMKDRFSLHAKSLEEVLSDPEWRRLESRWKSAESCPEVCVRSCGVAREYVEAFGNDPKAYDQEGTDNHTFTFSEDS